MTEGQILATLRTWQDAMQECDMRLDELTALTGPVVESPLGNAIYRLMGCYTDATADLIGWDESTLTSWWCEQNFGERPMKIGFSGEPMQSINTIEALAEFIAEDLRRSP